MIALISPVRVKRDVSRDQHEDTNESKDLVVGSVGSFCCCCLQHLVINKAGRGNLLCHVSDDGLSLFSPPSDTCIHV